jgi:hypothetical protein
MLERTDSRSERANSESLAYINWYINGSGRPWTSLDMIPEMRHDPGQPAGSRGVPPVTTDHMAVCPASRPVTILEEVSVTLPDHS